jgi:hypothetical protein
MVFATCHPERRHLAKGLCTACYKKQWDLAHPEAVLARKLARQAADSKKRCEHGKIQYYCKTCKGGGICEHGRQRCRCRKCGAEYFCEHGRVKRRCGACSGEYNCEHGRYKYICKECGGLPALAYLMYRGAKARAKKKNLPFNITVEEILELIGDGRCPIFGTPYNLESRGITDTSANLDRTFPDLGYTKANCVVLSNLANRIKTDATAQEIRKVLEWSEANNEPIEVG